MRDSKNCKLKSLGNPSKNHSLKASFKELIISMVVLLLNYSSNLNTSNVTNVLEMFTPFLAYFF